MDYVAYHSQDEMGSELRDGPPFGMLSRKPIRHLAGNTIWVVEGRGKKKQYFLKQRFHVDTVEEIVDEYFRFQYVRVDRNNLVNSTQRVELPYRANCCIAASVNCTL